MVVGSVPSCLRLHANAKNRYSSGDVSLLRSILSAQRLMKGVREELLWCRKRLHGTDFLPVHSTLKKGRKMLVIDDAGRRLRLCASSIARPCGREGVFGIRSIASGFFWRLAAARQKDARAAYRRLVLCPASLDSLIGRQVTRPGSLGATR